MSRKPRTSFAWGNLLGASGLILGLGIFLVLGWGYWQRAWNGVTRFTVISWSPQLTVKTFDPQTNRGLILVFPDNLEIESIAGRGQWQANKIQEAGNRSWAAESVADYLGINYTGVEGHLSWWDSWQWWWKTRQLQWQEVTVAKTGLLTVHQAVDGESVQSLNANWDNKAKIWFASQSIAQEGLELKIVNTTTTVGLGTHAARVIESLGFKVTSVEDSDSEIESCLLTFPKNLKSNLGLKLVQKIFGCQTQVSEQIELWLGSNYRQWWLGE